MQEHDVVKLNADFSFHTKGHDKDGGYERSGIIPKGTVGAIVSDIKGGGCWVEFLSILDDTKKEDGIHWIEIEYLEVKK